MDSSNPQFFGTLIRIRENRFDAYEWTALGVRDSLIPHFPNLGLFFINAFSIQLNYSNACSILFVKRCLKPWVRQFSGRMKPTMLWPNFWTHHQSSDMLRFRGKSLKMKIQVSIDFLSRRLNTNFWKWSKRPSLVRAQWGVLGQRNTYNIVPNIAATGKRENKRAASNSTEVGVAPMTEDPNKRESFHKIPSPGTILYLKSWITHSSLPYTITDSWL